MSVISEEGFKYLIDKVVDEETEYIIEDAKININDILGKGSVYIHRNIVNKNHTQITAKKDDYYLVYKLQIYRNENFKKGILSFDRFSSFVKIISSLKDIIENLTKRMQIINYKNIKCDFSIDSNDLATIIYISNDKVNDELIDTYIKMYKEENHENYIKMMDEIIDDMRACKIENPQSYITTMHQDELEIIGLMTEDEIFAIGQYDHKSDEYIINDDEFSNAIDKILEE